MYASTLPYRPDRVNRTFPFDSVRLVGMDCPQTINPPAVIPALIPPPTSFPHLPSSYPHSCPPYPRPPTSFPQPPTSFPRRRESPPCVRHASIAMPAQKPQTIRIEFDKTELTYYSGTMTTPRNHIPRRQPQCTKHPTCQPRHNARATLTRHPTPNRLAPQEPTPNSPSAKFNRIRHNPTECHTMQRKLVPARAHAREATAFRFLALGMDCAQAAADSTRPLDSSCRPLALTPIDRTERTNRLCLTLHSTGFTMEGAAWHSPSGQYW